ncbi:MAG: hypothetical protein GY784_09905 [Gammaproteobacteria bacterium]|nr:hypothetical protein [Gammaproteobacteria bacterium]
MTYDYEWITTERLNPFQFYQAVSTRFKHNHPISSRDEEEVGDFSCHQKMLGVAGQRWQVSSCFRRYLKYDQLYDASLAMVSIDHNDRALLVKFAMSGISKKNAVNLFKRVMESIEWKL